MIKIIRIFVFIGLIISCLSFNDRGNKVLNFQTERSLKKTMKFLKDSTDAIQILGSNFETDFRSQCLRTTVGSTTTRSYSYNYFDLGITIYYNETANVTPNDDFTDVIVQGESNGIYVEIDSNSSIAVFGYKTNESQFGELIKKQTRGIWMQFHQDDHYYFSYVTKYVNFNSALFTQESIDSLNLDYDEPEVIENYFKNELIKSISIRESDSFYQRLKD